MGWKNLPAWLKGRIIGLVVGIFLYLFLISLVNMSDPLESSIAHEIGILSIIGLLFLG